MPADQIHYSAVCETIAAVFPSEYEIAGEAAFVVDCLNATKPEELPHQSGHRFDVSAVNTFIATLVPVVLAVLKYLEVRAKSRRDIALQSEEIEKVLLEEADRIGFRIAKTKATELARAIAKQVR